MFPIGGLIKRFGSNLCFDSCAKASTISFTSFYTNANNSVNQMKCIDELFCTTSATAPATISITIRLIIIPPRGWGGAERFMLPHPPPRRRLQCYFSCFSQQSFRWAPVLLRMLRRKRDSCFLIGGRWSIQSSSYRSASDSFIHS